MNDKFLFYKNKGVLLIVLTLMASLFLPFSTSISINNPSLPLVQTDPEVSSINEGANYSINVNNSNYLQGYQWANAPYPSDLYSTYNASYVPYTGASSNVNLNTKHLTNVSNINMGNNNLTSTISFNNTNIYTFERDLNTTLQNTVSIGCWGLTSQGSGIFDIWATSASGSVSVAKRYNIPVYFSGSADYSVVSPIASTGSYGGNDFELDIQSSGATTCFRFRHSAGASAQHLYITVLKQGKNNDTFTESSTSAGVTAPSTQYNGNTLLSPRVEIGNPILINTLSYTNWNSSGNRTSAFIADSNNGGSSLYSPIPVIVLAREGKGGQSYANNVEFKVGRFENVGTNPRTKLVIGLTHDIDTAGRNIMTLLSNGYVGINTSANPIAPLEIAGSNGGGIGLKADSGFNFDNLFQYNATANMFCLDSVCDTAPVAGTSAYFNTTGYVIVRDSSSSSTVRFEPGSGASRLPALHWAKGGVAVATMALQDANWMTLNTGLSATRLRSSQAFGGVGLVSDTNAGTSTYSNPGGSLRLIGNTSTHTEYIQYSSNGLGFTWNQYLGNDTSPLEVAGANDEKNYYLERFGPAIAGVGTVGTGIKTLSLYRKTGDVVIGNYSTMDTGYRLKVNNATFGDNHNVNITNSGNLIVGGDLNITGNVHIDGNVSFKRPYGMYSSTETQTIAAPNTAYVVTFNLTEDDYEMTKENNENFSVGQSGDYLIELSAIFVTDTNNKHVEIWIQKTNSTGVFNNIPRSNTKVEIENSGTEQVIAVPFIIDLLPTEKFRIMYASDDAGSQLLYTTNTSYSPDTPSIIMTFSKISEITT